MSNDNEHTHIFTEVTTIKDTLEFKKRFICELCNRRVTKYNQSNDKPTRR